MKSKSNQNQIRIEILGTIRNIREILREESLGNPLEIQPKSLTRTSFLVPRLSGGGVHCWTLGTLERGCRWDGAVLEPLLSERSGAERGRILLGF